MTWEFDWVTVWDKFVEFLHIVLDTITLSF